MRTGPPKGSQRDKQCTITIPLTKGHGRSTIVFICGIRVFLTENMVAERVWQGFDNPELDIILASRDAKRVIFRDILNRSCHLEVGAR